MRQPVAGHLLPAHAEMRGDIRDRRPFEARGDVMPADLSAGDVRLAVEPVSALHREIDAADEGDAVVDDDRLLVVAVQRALPGVGRPLHLRPATELLHGVPHRAREGRKSGSGAPAQTST